MYRTPVRPHNLKNSRYTLTYLLEVCDYLFNPVTQFRNDFEKKIGETILRVGRSTQEELKMPRQPELRHQYGMLFDHQGYVMLGLQSLQLFLAVDLPKIEDLYHEPPEFPNCSM